MGYHDYISQFSRDDLKNNIKADIANSKEFVNIFLGHLSEKTDDDKIKLFDKVVDSVASTIIESKEI